MLYDEDDCLPLSGIQHLAFCPRQFALIHIERFWAENVLTFEGRAMHDRADNPFLSESRGTVLITRSVPLLSRTLGLFGIADVVEFRLATNRGAVLEGREGMWMPFPVEYKRGKAKPDDRDMVQLCAQALCLEEMLGLEIMEGALFYGRTRRRQGVTFNGRLRKRVTDLAQHMHELYDRGVTPPPVRTPACRRCSLEEFCLPRVAATKSVRRYVRSISKSMNREGQGR